MASPNKNEEILNSPKSSNKYRNLKELISHYLDDEEKEKANGIQMTKQIKTDDNVGSSISQRDKEYYQIKEENIGKMREELREIEDKQGTFKPELGKSTRRNHYNTNIRIENRYENEQLSPKKISIPKSYRNHGLNSKSPPLRINIPSRISSPPKYNDSITESTSSSLFKKNKDKSNIISIKKGMKKDHSADSIHYERTSQNIKTVNINDSNYNQINSSQVINNIVSSEYNAFAIDNQPKAKRIYLNTSTDKRSIRPSIQSPKNPRTRCNNNMNESKLKSYRSEGKVLNMINEDNSAEVIYRLKYAKYKEIFDSLDSNKDGLISSKNIGLCALPHWQLKALTPILEDLQRTQANMDFKAFCIKIGKLLTTQLFDENDLYIMKDHLGENIVSGSK